MDTFCNYAPCRGTEREQIQHGDRRPDILDFHRFIVLLEECPAGFGTKLGDLPASVAGRSRTAALLSHEVRQLPISGISVAFFIAFRADNLPKENNCRYSKAAYRIPAIIMCKRPNAKGGLSFIIKEK
jgi:hypothetical protein